MRYIIRLVGHLAKSLPLAKALIEPDKTLVGQLPIEYRFTEMQFELTNRQRRQPRGQCKQWVNCELTN